MAEEGYAEENIDQFLDRLHAIGPQPFGSSVSAMENKFRRQQASPPPIRAMTPDVLPATVLPLLNAQFGPVSRFQEQSLEARLTGSEPWLMPGNVRDMYRPVSESSQWDSTIPFGEEIDLPYTAGY